MELNNMKISKIEVRVEDLANGYEEKGTDGIEGVVAYNGLLDVRPPYQREFVYAPKERDEVIRTLRKGFPLNIMYWAKTDDGKYEVMDGQQRTISICRYIAEDEQSFSVDQKYFFNLDESIQQKLKDYVLDVYVCEGRPEEIHDWFKVINIAGKELTPQELRNTAYTGTWLSDAKLHFSKPNCVAYNIAKDYMNGSPIRQEYLEKALEWIIDTKDGMNCVEDYMALNQHKENADELWTYFKKVISWVQETFPNYRKIMKGIEWGLLYNEYSNNEYDPDVLENEIVNLLIDDDIDNQKGIYDYLLSGKAEAKERLLNIRVFTEKEKNQLYEIQHHKCGRCRKVFPIDELDAHHKIQWADGGHTTIDNGILYCKDCHTIIHNNRT